MGSPQAQSARRTLSLECAVLPSSGWSEIFALNQRASNGVIHGITRVLIPVDIG